MQIEQPKIDEVTNLLLNMQSGLLPENLSKDEIDLLRNKFGENWFYELGYNDNEYKNPCKIDIQVVSLADIADVRKSIKSFQNLIDMYDSEFDEKTKEFAKERDEKQKPLFEEIEKLQDKLDGLMKIALDNAVYSEDKFLIAMKVKADSYRDGRYKIIRHKKENRILDQIHFRRIYPSEFNEFAKIGLTDADKAIGKNNVNKMCDIKVTYNFEFYDPDEHKKE